MESTQSAIPAGTWEGISTTLFREDMRSTKSYKKKRRMDYLKTSRTGGKTSRRADKQKGKTPRLKTKVLGHPLEAVNKQGFQVISTAYIPALVKTKSRKKTKEAKTQKDHTSTVYQQKTLLLQYIRNVKKDQATKAQTFF